MKNNKLKLGILLDSFSLPAWAFRSLERVINLDCASISVIILKENKNPGKYEPDLYYGNDHNITYQLASKIDKVIFQRGPDAFAPKNTQVLFPNVPVIVAKPINGGKQAYINPSDIARVKNYQLDILIRMGFEGLTGDILTSAKYGVWTYYHGDHRVIRSNLPGFWEVANRSFETGSILYILESDGFFGKVLYRSCSQTFPFSPSRNRNLCFWNSSSFLSRQINLLFRLGENGFFAEIEKYNSEFDYYDNKQYNSPSNFKVLWIYIKLLSRVVREVFLRAFNRDSWFLLFDMNDSSSLSFSSFKKIIPPKDRFWTDPHIIQKDGTNYIFVEEYVYKSGKGHIAVIEIDSQGHYKVPVPVLVEDYHLSYPFVFEYENKYYMVPETSQINNIDLYECVKFPTEWQFKMTLMSNVKAVDTTLFHHQGKWWLFTGIAENKGAFPEVELFIFHSDTLLTSEWKSHPHNPVISDVTSARPAGKLFIMDGKLYRPSQDCSRNYGYGFNINEIISLTETNYLEKKVATVKPNWDRRLVATHTFTRAEGISIIDVATRRSKLL